MTGSKDRAPASLWFWVIVAAAAVAFSARERVTRRSDLQLQTEALSATAESLLVNRSILDWAMTSGTSEPSGRASSPRPWVIVLIGGIECEACSDRRKSLRALIRTLPATSSASELWFVSGRLENPRPGTSSVAEPLVRYLRVTHFGELSGTMNSLPRPIALVVDSTGTIRAVSAGYHDGIDSRWLERSGAVTGLSSVTPR